VLYGVTLEFQPPCAAGTTKDSSKALNTDELAPIGTVHTAFGSRHQYCCVTGIRTLGHANCEYDDRRGDIMVASRTTKSTGRQGLQGRGGGNALLM
jgi:hypothetical protein